MGSGYPFPNVPNGWFVIGLSRELAPGDVRPVHYFDRELVLFRTEDGRARLFDAHCPHLGAHLGYGGRVVGNAIKCPFHGWCFDGEGQCVEAPFADKIPPAARTQPWHVHEADGLIYAWYHARGESPSWAPVTRMGEGWAPIESMTVLGNFHPQEIVENTADATHAGPVHGYLRPNEIVDAREDGPFWHAAWTIEISAEYAMAQVAAGEARLEDEVKLAGGPVGSPETAMRQTMRLTCSGLGVVDITHDLVMLGWPSLVRFCTTPVRGGEVECRVVTAVKPPADADAEMIRGVARHVLSFTVRDARQDIALFEHKKYLERPALAKSDGPLMRVRRWSRQFYSGLPVVAE